jgi:hypothetical protein
MRVVRAVATPLVILLALGCQLGNSTLCLLQLQLHFGRQCLEAAQLLFLFAKPPMKIFALGYPFSRRRMPRNGRLDGVFNQQLEKGKNSVEEINIAVGGLM